MEHSKETWRYFIKTKFALRVDTCSSTDNPLQGSDRTVKKSSILLQKSRQWSDTYGNQRS